MINSFPPQQSPEHPRANGRPSAAISLCICLMATVGAADLCRAQEWSLFARQPAAASAQWTARIEAAPRVADPRWTATVTWLRAEPLLPKFAAPAIPRRPATQTAPVTGESAANHTLEGIASYYWQDQMTASGERFDKLAMTAAHRTLPFGTRVRVTNVVNGRNVVVRINDRGPFKPGRVIDLSDAAAQAIDMKREGLVAVTVTVLDRN